jgi:hypothetical protein
MSLPLVYALCDDVRVAETLAVLLESDYDCRWLTDLGERPSSPLPPPALVLDARGSRPRSRRAPMSQVRWPGVPLVRMNLLDHFDPIAARRAVADAVRGDLPGTYLRAAVEAGTLPVAHDLKPRLVAAKCLLALAREEGSAARFPWPPLLQEQLVAILTYAEQLGVASSGR